MATTNDLKNGMTLDLDGQLWNVVEFQHVKPGKGPAFVRTKLKNVLSGKVVEKTFNSRALLGHCRAGPKQMRAIEGCFEQHQLAGDEGLWRWHEKGVSPAVDSEVEIIRQLVQPSGNRVECEPACCFDEVRG